MLVLLPASVIAVRDFNSALQKETENPSLWSVRPSIDTCHPAAWLPTGNVKGLIDHGHGMARVLKLDCAEETGAIKVLTLMNE